MSGRHAAAWAAAVPQYHGVRLVAVFAVGRVWPVYFYLGWRVRMSSEPNRWLTERSGSADEYDATYQQRAAAGEDVHGEADFVAALRVAAAVAVAAAGRVCEMGWCGIAGCMCARPASTSAGWLPVCRWVASLPAPWHCSWGSAAPAVWQARALVALPVRPAVRRWAVDISDVPQSGGHRGWRFANRRFLR